MENSEVKKYFGFYPNHPVWVGESLKTSDYFSLVNYTTEMSKVVAHHKSKYLDLLATRDGSFLIGLNFEKSTVGLYLDTLNAFYIILESVCSQFFFKKYFNIKEITIEDYIYYEYVNEKISKYKLDGAAPITVYNFRARYLSGFIPVDFNTINLQTDAFWPKLITHTINSDTRVLNRNNRVISASIVNQAFAVLERLTTNWDKVTLLAKLIKAIEELNLGNYEYVINYAWLIIEAYLYNIHTETEKKYSLAQSGENVTTLEVINNLKRLKLLPYELINELHQLRKIRNQIVHRQFKDVKIQDAILAIEIVREFIKRDTAIDIRLVY